MNQIISLVFACLLAAVSCQQHYDQYEAKKPLPAILSHKQSLGHDGSFQYSFAADNGLQQGESISPDGSRKGSYSYVDPNGKTITVNYTADKNGFHVQGDHLPKPVQPTNPQPQYQPNPKYQSPEYQSGQYQAAPQQHYDQYDRPASGYGPAVFPPAPPRNSAPSFPRPQYTQSASSYSPQQEEDDGDYDEKVDPNKPHTFGDGYSFHIGG